MGPKMTKTTALLKRVTLFAIAYCAIAALVANLAPFDSLHRFFLLWLSALWLILPAGAVVLFIVVAWTLMAHGQPQIQSEHEGHSDFDLSPKVSTGGHLMMGGLDHSGQPFGVNDD